MFTMFHDISKYFLININVGTTTEFFFARDC